MPLLWLKTISRAPRMFRYDQNDDYLGFMGEWNVARVLIDLAQPERGWRWSLTGLPVPGAHYGSEADLESAKAAAEACFRRWLSTVGLQERPLT